MTPIPRFLLAALFALAVAAPLQTAQARAPYSQAELDQMLAPIALYPDALLSQILIAATRPLEVVEAARWVRANPGLQGDDAVRAAQQQPWDPSVQSLAAFPQLLARMDENFQWTQALGEAFFVQEPVVMETVQELRRRARAAGHLAPDDRVRVYDDGPAIVIEPAAPEVVYAPYYDPWVVYGPWWWSAYPPVAWAPWPGYAVVRRPGVSTAFWWGPGFGVSIGFMVGSVDWFHRRVQVRVQPTYSRPVMIHRDPLRPRRTAPEPVAPQPRIEPRAERPYPRRDQHPSVTSAELRRAVPSAPAAVEPGPRFQQRAPRPETQRAERVPQKQATQSSVRQPQPQRIQRVPQTQPQTAPAPRVQPPPAQPQRTPPPPSQAPRVKPTPGAAPSRTEPALRRNGYDARERLQRGGARP